MRFLAFVDEKTLKKLAALSEPLAQESLITLKAVEGSGCLELQQKVGYVSSCRPDHEVRKHRWQLPIS